MTKHSSIFYTANSMVGQLRLSLKVKTFDRRPLSAKSTKNGHGYHYELFIHAC